jgi:predicted small secreted protein
MTIPILSQRGFPMMGRKKLLIWALLVCSVFLAHCTVVRGTGKIAAAAGNAASKSADEEEVNIKKERAAKAKEQPQSVEKAEAKQVKAEPAKSVTADPMVRVQAKYTSVSVRPDPSTRKAALVKLRGGDAVQKIDEKSGWVKVKYNVDGKEGQGWVKRDLLEE